MRNKYYLMRHAESLANVENRIASSYDTEAGVGLTPKGQRQVGKAVTSFGFDKTRLKIVSSDFQRAKETAIIVAEQLSVDPPIYTTNLRERYFGIFDGQSSVNYHRVWESDRLLDPNVRYSEESVHDVLDRMMMTINELELQYENRDILLVSHGDPLLILQASVELALLTNFRDLPEFLNAEIRQLLL